MAILETFREFVTVRVWGNKFSSRRRLHRMALSLAFGKIAPVSSAGITPPPGVVTSTYDAMNRAVEVSIAVAYNTNLMATLGTAKAKDVGFVSLLAGPDDDAVGGNYDAFTAMVVLGAPGLPAVLEDNARKVITPDATDAAGRAIFNPRPPGDNRAVTSFAFALITQALKSAPCDLPLDPGLLPTPAVKVLLIDPPV